MTRVWLRAELFHKQLQTVDFILSVLHNSMACILASARLESAPFYYSDVNLPSLNDSEEVRESRVVSLVNILSEMLHQTLYIIQVSIVGCDVQRWVTFFSTGSWRASAKFMPTGATEKTKRLKLVSGFNGIRKA